MKANEIVEKLKTSTYKFTTASKIRDEVKKLDEEVCDYLFMELRREIGNPHNSDIVKPLREILR
jgi:hypothetical protein